MRLNHTKKNCGCCEKHHPCGNRCYSTGGFDESSGCTAEQVASGVYRCDLCKVIVFSSGSNLNEYLSTIEFWYNSFCKSKGDDLYQLKKLALASKPLFESERALYDALEEFVDAKSILPYVTESESTQMRQAVYQLACAYENLKSCIG